MPQPNSNKNSGSLMVIVNGGEGGFRWREGGGM